LETVTFSHKLFHTNFKLILDLKLIYTVNPYPLDQGLKVRLLDFRQTRSLI
jgi:hypothetical protein